MDRLTVQVVELSFIFVKVAPPTSSFTRASVNQNVYRTDLKTATWWERGRLLRAVLCRGFT